MNATVIPTSIPAPDENNEWRAETPGAEGWARSARPDAENKFFMVSTDGHVQEPADLWLTRMDKKYAKRLPQMSLNAEGEQVQKTEGFRPLKIMKNLEFLGEDLMRNQAGKTVEERLADHAADGVDAEILFPNKGLAIWATPDAKFSQEMCKVWNDWAWEQFGAVNDVMSPMACIASADIEGAIKEIERCAEIGFRGLALPCKPVFGPPSHEDLNYNLREFNPLWECIQDTGLPITYHVSTGRDPRTARSQGGEVINYAVHALGSTMESVANMCASGVIERFPKLVFGTVESGIGWVPWALEAMDEAYKKHHMFARPKLQGLPSDYYRSNGFSTFQEEKSGLDLARGHNLVDNFMWANDYPHHEGTWPHSAAAIERNMVNLNDEERAKILGFNAARIFGFEIPERYQQ